MKRVEKAKVESEETSEGACNGWDVCVQRSRSVPVVPAVG